MIRRAIGSSRSSRRITCSHPARPGSHCAAGCTPAALSTSSSPCSHLNSTARRSKRRSRAMRISTSCSVSRNGALRAQMVRLSSAALAFVALFATAAAHAAGLPTVELSIKGHRLVAEVAATEATRSTGLMNRFSLQPDHGMLFVFRQPQPQAFWMKNTYVPLSIAFVDAGGRILNIDDMAPQTENPHPSRGLALYALEMKKGWFAAHGIGVGDRVEGVEKSPAARE